ncbi:MAG: hypothetical protein KAI24_10125 [Planctomycetes bacterium]|nr:hypothetical protein [Planctomycetota bacterium]
MTRVDLFLFAHKGLRAAMFATATQLARCDFRDPSAAAAAGAAVRRTLGFLQEHAEHENALIFGAIAAAMPDLAAGLHAEHALIHGQEEKLEPLLMRLARCGDTERVAVGCRLLGQWHVVVSQHLRHMEREEVEGNRVLQANLDDRALQALHGLVMARIPAARRAAWLELIRPALSPLDDEVLARRLASSGANGTPTTPNTPNTPLAG